MTSSPRANSDSVPEAGNEPTSGAEHNRDLGASPGWWKLFKGTKETGEPPPPADSSSEGSEEIKAKPNKWSMGILNDALTDEVPGMIGSVRAVSR